MSRAPLSTIRAEQLARLAPTTLAMRRPLSPGERRCRQANPKASSGSASEFTPKVLRAIIAATINPTKAQPTVQIRLTSVPLKNPTRQARSSLPVLTTAMMWGCAMIPIRPLSVSIRISQGPISPGAAKDHLDAGSVSFIPWNPPTKPHPRGISKKGKYDDQGALDQVRPDRGNQTANKAVKNKNRRQTQTS